MINRKKQKITSDFGFRKIGGEANFHNGVDLRSFNFTNWSRQEVIFPEDCRVLRIVRQKNWGWSMVAETLQDGYTLYFVHIRKPLLEIGHTYSKGTFISYTAVTEYMEAMKFGEHLHFRVMKDEKFIDPKIYFDSRGIPYE